jgi:hypothetical protein
MAYASVSLIPERSSKTRRSASWDPFLVIGSPEGFFDPQATIRRWNSASESNSFRGGGGTFILGNRGSSLIHPASIATLRRFLREIMSIALVLRETGE